MPLKIAIHGAGGRMGQRMIALAFADPELEVVAALESANHPHLGKDCGVVSGVGEMNVPLSTSWDAAPDVVIDFSVPASGVAIAVECGRRRVPLVLATTGFSPEQLSQIDEQARVIPLLRAPSMSLAVNLAMKLVSTAAAALADDKSGADVEIIERHHRFKEDSPSGTALAFGALVAQAMGQTEVRHGREGRPGARPHGEIGYHAVRSGDNPGEHTIVFGLLGETLEVAVRASSRDCYAHGALAAARFLAGKPPGRYSMQDVLGL